MPFVDYAELSALKPHQGNQCPQEVIKAEELKTNEWSGIGNPFIVSIFPRSKEQSDRYGFLYDNCRIRCREHPGPHNAQVPCRS